MRLLLLPAAALFVVIGCERASSSDIQALREELEQERALLRETREELATLAEELRPLTHLAKLMGRYDLEGADPPTGLDPFPDPVLPPGPPPTDADTQALIDAIEKGVKKVSDTEYRIDRAVVNKVLENPTAVARGARIVPSIKNGQSNGFKVYAIRPSSLYARIGIMNGDTIHSVNGFDLTSPDKALEVYTQVRDASSLEVELTRRGVPVTLRYRIR